MEHIICNKCHGTGKVKKSPYKKGACYEYIVKHKLEQKGYTVYRAYASRGTYDLIAIKGSVTLGIQVKSLKQTNKQYLTPKDRVSLNKELINTGSYKLYKWDMKIRGVVTQDIERPIKIIHAWKEKNTTKYAELVDIDEWKVFKP